MIDVRDLATWIVSAAEQRLDGVFNATGPTTTLGDVLTASAEAARSHVPTRQVPAAGSRNSASAPGWGPLRCRCGSTIPSGAASPRSTRRGPRAHGLETRPLLETLRDALAYEEQRSSARQAGLDDAEESRARAAPAGDG